MKLLDLMRVNVNDAFLINNIIDLINNVTNHLTVYFIEKQYLNSS